MGLEADRKSGRDGGSLSVPVRSEGCGSVVLPRVLVDAGLRLLGAAAGWLIRLGVRANAITIASAAVCAAGSVLVAAGAFAPAAVALTLGSLGDALDGMVARRTGTASVGGALLDATVDRYEELLLFAGLAVYLRASVPALVVVFAATAGSFLVSYGSARAEALGVAPPPSAMRRADRAACLCGGVALGALAHGLARMGLLPQGAERGPVLAALAVVGVVANVSAVRRLRALAAGDRLRASSGGQPIAVPALEGAAHRRAPATRNGSAFARTDIAADS